MEKWIKPSVEDYAKIVAAAQQVRDGVLSRSLALSEGASVYSNQVACWQLRPGVENAKEAIEVAVGFVIDASGVYCLPSGGVANNQWLPENDAYTELEVDTVGADGTEGYVFWYSTGADGVAPFPGALGLAASLDDLTTLVADVAAFVVLGSVLWDSLDPCGYKLQQYISSPLLVLPPRPDTQVTLAETELSLQCSVEESTRTLTSGKPLKLLQLYGFDKDNTTEYGFTDILSADPETGVIKAEHGERYFAVVQIRNTNGTRFTAYMPFGQGSGEPEPEPEKADDTCGVNGYPDGGEDDNYPGSGDGGDYPVDGGGAGEYPGKIDDCW